MMRIKTIFSVQMVFAFACMAGLVQGAYAVSSDKAIATHSASHAMMEHVVFTNGSHSIVPIASELGAIAFDVGGTGAKGGHVDEMGVLSQSFSFPTGPQYGPEEFVEQAAHIYVRYSSGRVEKGLGLLPVGLGVPGPTKDGILTAAPNLPEGWVRFPLAKRLADRITQLLKEDGVDSALESSDVAVNNDAKVAVFGAYGRMPEPRPLNVVGLTLGTGVGGASVVDGKLMLGAGMAGEIGHLKVVKNGRRCGCNSRGCCEAYAGRVGIERTAFQLLKDRELEDTAWTGLWPSRRRNDLTVKMLAKAAQAGDPLAKRAWDITGTYLGDILASVALINHPEAIILIGNIARAGNLLLDPIQRRLAKEPYPMFRLYDDPASFMIDGFTDYGVIGAGLLAMQSLKKPK